MFKDELKEECINRLIKNEFIFHEDDLCLPLMSYVVSSEEFDYKKTKDIFARFKERSSVKVRENFIQLNEYDQANSSAQADSLNSTLTLINTHSESLSQLYKMIDPFICSHSYFDSDHESSSDIKEFGIISYKMNSNCKFKWAEIVAHELAHMDLFSQMAFLDYSSTDLDELQQPRLSKIRNSNRPTVGVIHGAYAQASILQLFIAILTSVESNKDDKKKATQTIKNFKESFISDANMIIDLPFLQKIEPCAELIQLTKEKLLALDELV
jgi:hypothetical protein